jgi:hypothetical protein
MGKQSAPPPPDYSGAARETAAGNLEAAKFATEANRANQYTPYGNLIWNKVGDNKWEQRIDLNETGQQLLDAQNRSSLGLAGLQDVATDRVAQTQSTPFQYQNVQDVSDDAYRQQTSRLDPQWQQLENQTRTRLANQGIMEGSEAYQNSMREFNQGRNDAYGQARLNAYNMAPTQMQLASALRNQNLNELNALRTGSQVTNPQFSSYAQQATTQGADMLGATNALYGQQVSATNAQNAATGQMFGGLMGMAGTLGGAYLRGKN